MSGGIGYAQFEAGVALESKGGSVSWGRVAREMATNAAIHGAPNTRDMLEAILAETNIENHRGNSMRNALRALLYALHARPLFGGPHLSVEDAIAEANAVLDRYQPGKQA